MFRITPGTLIIAMFSVVLAAFAALQIRNMTKPAEVRTPQRQDQFTSLIVATRSLEPDRPLTEADVGAKRVTQDELARITGGKLYMLSANQVIGRVLRVSKNQDSFFQPDDFYSDRMGKTLIERLKQGFRAVTIKVDNVGSLDGHAVPGGFVDVIFRNDQGGSNMPIGAMTILADVEILAIGDNYVPNATGGPLKLPNNSTSFKETTVTLAVPADKANRLKVVEGRGTLSLMMRSKEDRDELVNYRPETLEGLMGIAPVKGPFVSQMFRRGRATTLVFSNGRVVDRRTYVEPNSSNQSNFGVLVPLSPTGAPLSPQLPNQPLPTLPQPNPNLNNDGSEVPDFNGQLLILQQSPKLEFQTRD